MKCHFARPPVCFFFSLSFTAVLRQATDCTSAHVWAACRADGEIHRTPTHSFIRGDSSDLPTPTCETELRPVVSQAEMKTSADAFISLLPHYSTFLCFCFVFFFKHASANLHKLSEMQKGLKGPLISFLSTGLT